MQLLIIEDNQKINHLIRLYAVQDGHQADQAFSAEEALAMLSSNTYDVVITDLMLPGLQGEELIGLIRSHSDVYIIVISAKTETKHKLDAIHLGADDFITKPFSVDEVMAKLKNLAKRIRTTSPNIRRYFDGELIISPLSRHVTFRKHPLILTRYEYDILWYLSSHPDRIISRDALIETLFDESDAYDRVIDAHIKNIRKKIDDDPLNPRYIKTHYGVGYQFIGVANDHL